MRFNAFKKYTQKSTIMKYLKIILFFTACISLVSCSKEKTKTGYHGNVKSVTYKDFSGIWKFGEFQKQGTKNVNIYIYNAKGDLIENSQFGSDASLIEKSTNKYNDKGNLIESIIFKSNGSIKTKSTNKYDAKYNLIETITYNSDGSVKTKRKNQYNETDKQIESITYNSNEIIETKTTSDYDSNGNLIEMNSYNSDGNLNGKYIFDVKGNAIQHNYYREDGSLAIKSIRSYDIKGNLIELNDYYSNGKLSEKRTYKYDTKGICLEMIVYYNNAYLNRNSKEITKHDSNGDRIEYSTYDLGGTEKEKTIYRYTYDLIGNWITENTLENGIQTEYSEREIQYY